MPPALFCSTVSPVVGIVGPLASSICLLSASNFLIHLWHLAVTSSSSCIGFSCGRHQWLDDESRLVGFSGIKAKWGDHLVLSKTSRESVYMSRPNAFLQVRILLPFRSLDRKFNTSQKST